MTRKASAPEGADEDPVAGVERQAPPEAALAELDAAARRHAPEDDGDAWNGEGAEPPLGEGGGDPEMRTLCTMLVAMGGITAAQVTGYQGWAFSDAEAAELGGAYAAVIVKYFPDARFGVEAQALLLTVTIVGSRVPGWAAHKAAQAQEEGAGGAESES
jgi:hypothetical protein